MVMRVQHVDGEYRVVLSREAMDALHLTEGAEVELRPVAEEPNGSAAIRHMSVDEALKAYRDTLPQHIEAYRELAN
jgi:antitoxin component of MazEF toxin-antitoxin module